MQIAIDTLPTELRNRLIAHLGIGATEMATVEWQDPEAPTRIIVEAWDRNPGPETDRPQKRYILSKTMWWKDAVAFKATNELPSLRHLLVPQQDAHYKLLELELANPSQTFLRVGRIWDLARENCREWQRQPEAGYVMPLGLDVRQVVMVGGVQ